MSTELTSRANLVQWIMHGKCQILKTVYSEVQCLTAFKKNLDTIDSFYVYVTRMHFEIFQPFYVETLNTVNS